MLVDVLDLSKKKVGEAELSPSVFEAEVKEGLIHEVVLWQLAKRRAGTHNTKVRSEVSGGGRKPWKQKGTGRARAGSIRSSLWRGGSITFGPRPRDYSYSIPKKVRRGALISALSSKVKENAVVVVDSVALAEPKTKLAALALNNLGLSGKTLVVVDKIEPNTGLGFRNIPRVKLMSAQGLNVYDVLNANNLLITKEALGVIQESLGK
ncbi:MAG: 50S ribosomal protein L4 [Nitrospinae bacterium]|nr:50S ribosomal protein L4 [Nitrospinota bacterium]